MGKYKDMKTELKELIEMGEKLYRSLLSLADGEGGDYKEYLFFRDNYEIWYTKALKIIIMFIPERKDDFILFYSNPKRKDLNLLTYTISDALRGLRHKKGDYGPASASTAVFRQNEILRACYQSFDSNIWNIQTLLQADIFDSELESARYLLKNGYLRAAGAICGVVLEKHFGSICKRRKIKIVKKNPTISDYNDLLKDSVYDTIEWRKIQHLGDIRNLCDHSKGREPMQSEVDELIIETDRIIKTIF